jgi:16S rRNA (guanine527-N7)-methyltransferase
MADVQSTLFQTGVRQLRLSLNAEQYEQLLRYRHELLDWNTRMNLTAITDAEEVLLKHFLDSLSLLSVYDGPLTRALDIGTGAGFPGLVLKIVRPQWQMTLLEATGKKVTFLQHVIDVLQLKDVEAIHGRAEELAHRSDYRGAFDLVTARAVAALPLLLEYAAPYCRVGGTLVFPKKGDLAEEIAQGKRAGSLVGASFVSNTPVVLPGLADGRCLLVWRQQKPCPTQYPRSGGVILKKPLGSF